MLTECFRAQSEGQVPLGRAADGRSVYTPFRPSVVQLAHLVTPFLDEVNTEADTLPLPRGITLSLCAHNGQLQISLSATYARRFRRVYGYIAEIKLRCPHPNTFLISFRFGVSSC